MKRKSGVKSGVMSGAKDGESMGRKFDPCGKMNNNDRI